MIKSTLGTGCFVMLNTGNSVIKSRHQLLSTVVYRIKNKVTYGLEGSIFSAGAALKWLRENLKLIKTFDESEKYANTISDTHGVYFVPAFTGLAAPYWDAAARAAIVGITRDTQIADIVRAALESVCYQAVDLIHAMSDDFLRPLSMLQIDGGMSCNNWLLQFLSDMLGLPVMRPTCFETTALGVAFLAGMQAGIFSDFVQMKTLVCGDKIVLPLFSNEQREKFFAGWKMAVKRVTLR
jgi:glycerol kinase